MKASELMFFTAFGVVSTFVITSILRDRFKKRRAISSLAGRNRNNDEQFGREFSLDAKRADLAVRIRGILSKNLEMPLDGLKASDRLDDDLNAELAINPHLFWELEAGLGIKLGVEDAESFEKTLERLITFQDLVEFVETRIAEPLPTGSDKDENEKSSRAYEFGIRSVPVLCVSGFVSVVIGILLQKRTIMNLGGLIFISGFAIWGLANGGEMLRNIIQSIRSSSWRETVRRPLPLILLTSLALFFLWIGCTVLWGIFKNLSFSK